MATVIKTKVVSLASVVYDVYLDNGAPDNGGRDLAVRASSLDYKPETEDVDAHLRTSKMTVTFSVRDAADYAVLSPMVTADELQYRLRIVRDGQLFWVGFVLLDLVEYDFGGYPYNFTISATDGISRLKSIDYEQGALPEFSTLREHLFNILDLVPLSDYYATGEEYLRVHSSLVPEGMTPGTNVNLFEKSRVGFKALRTVDKKGEIKRQKAYSALLEILKGLNAILIYSQGRYIITDINSYARPSTTITFFRYDQAGTAIANETQLTWIPSTIQIGDYLASSDAVALARGRGGTIPPLKAVDLTYKHYSRQNLFPGITWSDQNYGIAQINGYDGNEGAGRLVVSAEVGYTVDAEVGAIPDGVGRLWVTASVLIAIEDDGGGPGGQSLKRTATITPAGISYSEPEWVDGLTSTYDFMLPGLPTIPGQVVYNRVSLISPVAPQSGTLKFALRMDRDFTRDGNNVAYPVTVGYEYANAFVESLLTGSISGQYNYTNFRPETGAAGFNSVVLERELLFGDGPGGNTFGRIEYTENGTEWERASTWRRWSGGDYLNVTAMPHGALIARMILALQESPREQLDITIIAPTYNPEFMLGCDAKLYLMKSGRLNLDRDEWRGRWFEIAENFVDATVVGTNHETDPVTGTGNAGGTNEPDLPQVGGGGFVPPSTGDSPGNTAPAINTVTTSTGDDILIEDGEIGNIPINNLPDVPLFAGDIITISNPATGETQNIELAYDSGYILGQMTDPGAVPFYTDSGITWLVPSTTEVAVVPFTPSADFPAGSYIQPNAQHTAQLQSVLRIDYVEAQLFGFNEDISVGYTNWFWRPELRQGQHIRKVHFAFAQDMGGTAKVNLKYFDATGERYTVATYDGGGLGGVEAALTDILEGYYRFQVESVSINPPKGLVVFIEYVKTPNS